MIPCAPRLVDAAEVRGRFVRLTAGFFVAVRRLTGRVATTVGAAFFGATLFAAVFFAAAAGLTAVFVVVFTAAARTAVLDGLFGAAVVFAAARAAVAREVAARGLDAREDRADDEALLLIPAPCVGPQDPAGKHLLRDVRA